MSIRSLSRTRTGQFLIVAFALVCSSWVLLRLLAVVFSNAAVYHLDGEECQGIVDQLITVLPEEWPEKRASQFEPLESFFGRLKQHFNVNDVFSALPRLAMKPGYELDFVFDTSLECEPDLYARPSGSPPRAAVSDQPKEHPSLWNFHRYTDDRDTDYLQFVWADGSPESYFELVVLRVMGTHFWQFGHSNYNDRTVVCARSGLPAPVLARSSPTGYEVPADVYERARYLDFHPIVKDSEDDVDVSVVVFSKYRGFSREVFRIPKKSPECIREVDEEVLLPYNCGVFF